MNTRISLCVINLKDDDNSHYNCSVVLKILIKAPNLRLLKMHSSLLYLLPK
jgi:hypothetical protein